MNDEEEITMESSIDDEEITVESSIKELRLAITEYIKIENKRVRSRKNLRDFSDNFEYEEEEGIIYHNSEEQFTYGLENIQDIDVLLEIGRVIRETKRQYEEIQDNLCLLHLKYSRFDRLSGRIINMLIDSENDINRLTLLLQLWEEVTQDQFD